ncbi:LamG domain-containing protein [Glycomyces niveus]|uniref:LamG domain-containing protein n=1 Tax=Glycomyces niveus TaxID=2820287 RepID=A0ABS3U4Y0_9ACTN|nr:LamG domain-containing protein [Glycomyces sp. NEAU-S30]MBO3733830.1 LamG domain-containing protein [Glycomyces sp. NEAU-S30]
MTSPHPRRAIARSLTIGLASVIAGAALSTPPALAEEPNDASCTAPDSGLQESNEADALALAAACDAEVLIRDMQDYTSRSYAQPDGSTTTEFRAVPGWVPDESGDWVEVDTTVEVAEDGSLEAVATVMDLRFGAAGTTEFVSAVSADGEQVSLSWPDPLPAPVAEGSTVVYPDVLPDVDLEVYAGVSDFSYALVVKTPEAAASPELEQIELGLTTDGLAVSSDSEADTAQLTDAEGESAFGVATPLMWDSSAAAEGTPELAAAMELEIDADSLTVVPDQTLLDDPDAQYPIYIDPKFYDTSVSWTNFLYGEAYANEITCGNGAVMCTGLQLWENDPTLGYWRAGMIFNGIQALADREVRDAGVWITQTHTAGVGKTYDVKLVAMNSFNVDTAAFDDVFNSKVVGTVATDSVPTSNDNYNETDQTIAWTSTTGLKNRMQALADDGSNTAPFAVVSGDETDRYQWRKMDPSTATLLVTHAANPPRSLKTAGKDCSTSAPGLTLNTLQPVLTATTPSNLLSSTHLDFRVVDPGPSPDVTIAEMTVSGVAESTAYSATVPSGKLVRGKNYYWEARVRDADSSHDAVGEWTANCHFRLNQLPTTPTALKTEDQACGTQASPTLVTSTTPKFSALPGDPDDGSSLVTRFRFYAQTGDHIWEDTETLLEGGTSAITRLSANEATEGLYRWNARTEDAFTQSAWSAYCWVRIDSTPPSPPDVVQVTTSPLPGQTVTFELISDSDVKSFNYSFNSAAEKSIPATAGRAQLQLTLPATGSIQHTLQVTAWDVPVGSTGNPSSPTTLIFTAIAAQPAEAVGAWRFDGDLLDDAGEHDLTPLGAAVTGPDRAGRPDSAAVFDGTSASCLKAGSPIVDTKSSYTVAGWVNAASAPASEAAVIDVTGAVSSNMKLLLTTSGKWGVAMSNADGGTTGVSVVSPTTAQFGTWTHVSAVYDAAAVRLRLYVNGFLVGSKEAPDAWTANGVFSVGCGVKASGSTFGHFAGSVDDAVIFGQPLTGQQIDESMGGAGIPAALQAWYPLRYDKTPGVVPGADYSGRGPDLTAMPTTPVWESDQHGRENSALKFDGSTCPTAETVPVRTDSAFTVSAWVRLDADHLNAHPRVFSFHGSQYFSVMAKYNASTDRWNVSVTSEDSAAPDWGEGAVSTETGGATETEWTQITVAVDPDHNRLDLFVNGAFSDSGVMSTEWDPWRASEFVIGCGGTSDGARYTQWDGAISDVRVWRGALDATEVNTTHTEALGWWELGEVPEGTDAWGGHDLTLNGAYSWELDRYNFCWAAYGLSLEGQGWAETAGPVITTDESFTVAAWVRLDDTDGYRTIVSQTGTTYGAFNLSYNPNAGRFQLSMPQSDSENTKWTRALANSSPVVGKWYHLAAQVDLGAGTIRLYVDGVLQDQVGQLVDSPWQANGPLTIGAAEQFGTMVNQMVGGIDEVVAFSGVLDEQAIKTLAEDNPGPEPTGDPECTDPTDPPPVID